MRSGTGVIWRGRLGDRESVRGKGMQVLWSIGGMAPTRRGEIAKFGVRAVVAGTLVNLMSAAIAGMLVG